MHLTGSFLQANSPGELWWSWHVGETHGIIWHCWGSMCRNAVGKGDTLGLGAASGPLGVLYHKSLFPLEIFVMQFGLNTANTAFSLIYSRPNFTVWQCIAILHTNTSSGKNSTQRSDIFHSTKFLRLKNPHSNIWYTTEVICGHSCVWARHKGDTLKQK